MINFSLIKERAFQPQDRTVYINSYFLLPVFCYEIILRVYNGKIDNRPFYNEGTYYFLEQMVFMRFHCLGLIFRCKAKQHFSRMLKEH